MTFEVGGGGIGLVIGFFAAGVLVPESTDSA